MKFAPLKQSHSRGALSIAHNVDSREEKVVSCGVDGLIFVWDKDSISSADTSPRKREISERTHSCCALYDNQVYAGLTMTDLSTGVEKQVVGSFGIKDEKDAVKSIMSFSLEITTVRVSQDWIVAGSSDFSVKRAERADPSSGYNKYELNAQVLDVQINPFEQMFAVSSCDGFITFFAGDDTEPLSSHKIFPPIRDLDDSFPRVIIAWSVDGKSLFVPCRGMVKVMAMKGSKWSVVGEFKHEDEKETDFSVVAASPCGKYLAASSMSSLIHIWEIESGLLVSTADYGKERAGRVTCLAYLGETSKKLVVADSHGNITTVEESAPSKDKNHEKKSSIFVDDEAVQEDSFDANEREEDEDDNIIVKKNKKFIVEEDEMDEDTRMSSSIAAIKKKYGYEDGGERMGEEEGNSFDEDPFSNIDAHPGSSTNKLEKNEKSAPVRVVEKYTPPTHPSYFSSSSSPRNLTQRYIKWNGYGMIRVMESEDGESSLEISFHDSSIHAEIIRSNSEMNYSMGDLNDRVVALATRLKGASKHLYVKLLNSWESTDDHWDMQMTKGELPEDVVVSSEFVALLCENRNIRLFTHAGTQRHIITHPTPILSLAAFNDRLAVVSFSGGPLFYTWKDETDYEFPLVVNEYRLGATSHWWSTTAMTGSSPSIRDQPLSLSKGTDLSWIGYTNRGRIVAQGSDTVIRLLVSPPHCPSFWTPIFDGREALTSPSDFIWPVSLVERPTTELRYVYCRGVKYPMVTLKLNPIVANWSLPLCNKGSDKSTCEEELFLNELALAAATDPAEMKDLSSSHLKNIIKLFSLAVKGDRESRAVEMANLTTSSKGVQLLVNWAAKQRRNGLVEKVSDIGRRKAEVEEEASNGLNATRGWDERERENGERLARVLPKKVPLRRSVAAAAASKYRMSEEKDDYALSSVDEPASEISSSPGIFNLESSAPAKNPFKRSLDDSIADMSSTSVFDDFDSPAPTRKKLKETQNTAPAPLAKKQAKLTFGSDKKTSGFDLWLEENEDRLKGDFVGGEEDFAKYCTQAYRMLSAAEKKEWRTKAESSS